MTERYFSARAGGERSWSTFPREVCASRTLRNIPLSRTRMRSGGGRRDAEAAADPVRDAPVEAVGDEGGDDGAGEPHGGDDHRAPAAGARPVAQ